MMVKMMIIPLDGGKRVTKLMEIWDQGRLGIGNGCQRLDRG